MIRSLLLIIITMMPYTTHAQVAVEIEINANGDQPPTLDLNTLNQQGVNGISGLVPGTVDTILVAEQCGQGTYSGIDETGSQVCVPCQAGTASAVSGASDPSTCIPCTTGAYAALQSSACSNCNANTFSVTPMAATAGACLTCPPHTTSNAVSDSVEDCVCNSGFFLSDNIISVANSLTYDYIPPGISDSLQFKSAVSIDVVHVINCQYVV